MTPPFSSLTEVAKKAALQAGSLIKKGYQSALEIKEKEGKQNLVTQYDVLVEKTIIESIHEAFPSHAIFAEESGQSGTKSDVTWVIDPIDGTFNFAKKIPMFCVSIGVQKGGEMVTGVIYQPITEELFIAEKGKGAFLNGKKLTVSSTTKVSKGCFATGFPYDLTLHKKALSPFQAIVGLGVPIRRIGSAALDIAYVAAGRFEGFWELMLAPWDYGAASLILEESGGKCTTLEGGPLSSLPHSGILATNGKVHLEMIDLIQGAL